MSLQKRKMTELDWDLVRVFLQVARTSRLGPASAVLGLDVSTVSRRLDRLEKTLGITLFERSREGVLITEAGERLLPAAEEMAHAMSGFRTTLATVEAEAEGIVRLTTPPGVADVFIAPALKRFHALHPKVRVDLDASVGYADLTRGEADIALRTRKPTRGDLLALRVSTTRTVPCTSRAYARELGILRSTSDARWIGWGDNLAHIPEARWMQKHVSVPPTLRTSAFFAQLAAAESGLGIMLAPDPYLAHFALTPVRVSKVLNPAWAALPTGHLWLVGHMALRRVPRVTALWSFLVRELSAKVDV